MSIARAVIEHIREKLHAKTLFATHYHELTDLEDGLIRNFCIAVKEKGRDVSFLRRIIPGAADKSYGIHVARLAGLPKAVTERAEHILAGLESEAESGGSGLVKEAQEKKAVKADNTGMMSLFGSSINDELMAMDIMTMTPIEALNKLYELQLQAKGEAGRS